jgi:phage/plasmid-like protein (TIGR03299 family)
MPANVETAVYANTPAWHGEGVVIDTEGKLGLDVDTAIEQSGLDWEVVKVPIYAKFEGKLQKIDGRYGVQRLTDGKVFGTVGGTWQPVQNSEGFSILQTLLELAGGEIWIESAGALDGGKKVWILARCGGELQISIAGEDYKTYIGFTNGHDGRTSVTSFMCDERVVCANTLTYALSKEDAGNRIIRVRHTTKASEKIAEAAHILHLRNLRTEELARQGEWLVEHEMSDSDFESFLAKLMPIEEEGTPAATMIGQRRDAVQTLYAEAPTLAAIRGTRWAALQAVTEFVDHGRPTKNVSALIKTQFGLTPSPLKQQAFALLVKPRI